MASNSKRQRPFRFAIYSNTINGIHDYENFAQAYAASRRSHDVQRITIGMNTWWKKRKNIKWSDILERKLAILSATYASSITTTGLYWVRREVFPPNYDAIMKRKDITNSEKILLKQLDSVQECITDEQFICRFGKLVSDPIPTYEIDVDSSDSDSD